MKRVLDVVLATILLLIALPAILLAALLIVLVDGRPVFFVQQREGLHGRPFRLLKLRTMRRDAEARLQATLADPLRAAEWEAYLRLDDDPRVLGRIGRALRRSSLDEVPQLVNVLRGSMSLVGPRPLPVALVDMLPDDALDARRIVKPGLTGLWQVSGRSDNDVTGLVELDLAYVRDRSVVTDLRILLATPRVVLTRRGAF